MDLHLPAFIPNREFLLAVPYKPAYFWVRQILRADVTGTYTVWCPVCSWKKGPTLFHFLFSSVLWALVSSWGKHTPVEINRQRNNIGRSQSFSFAALCVFLPSGSSELLMCLCLVHPIWEGPAGPLLGTCSSSSFKDSGRFTSTGGLAWMSKETPLSPWPYGGSCMSDVEKISPWLTSSSYQIEELSRFVCRLVNHAKALARLREIKAIAYLVCSMGLSSSVKAYI